MKTVSIGFVRDDDFVLLATLNNNDEYLTPSAFEALCEVVRSTFELLVETDIQTIERQDAPDHITLEEDANE